MRTTKDVSKTQICKRRTTTTTTPTNKFTNDLGNKRKLEIKTRIIDPETNKKSIIKKPKINVLKVLQLY